MDTVKLWVRRNLDRSGPAYLAARSVKGIAELLESVSATWGWPALITLAVAINDGATLDISVVSGFELVTPLTWPGAALLSIAYFGYSEYEENVRCTYGTD